MKKIFFLFIIIISLSSCKKLPINGNLDGMWHLLSVENIKGEIENKKEEQIYYNIQLHLLYLRKLNYGPEYYGRFIHTNDSLIFHDFRFGGDNSQLATKEDLNVFGLKSVTERFAIEKLTKGEMILRSESSRMSFRKF